MTEPGTKTTVRITNDEPLSSENHYDEKATVSRNSQKEIGGIHYFVDEVSIAPKGKNLVVTIEEYRPAEDVPPGLPFLTQRRTVALKDADESAKIVLKVYMHNGNEISVFDFASDGAEIVNSPLSKQSFFTTDEEERLMKSLGMTR